MPSKIRHNQRFKMNSKDANHLIRLLLHFNHFYRQMDELFEWIDWINCSRGSIVWRDSLKGPIEGIDRRDCEASWCNTDWGYTPCLFFVYMQWVIIGMASDVYEISNTAALLCIIYFFSFVSKLKGQNFIFVLNQRNEIMKIDFFFCFIDFRKRPNDTKTVQKSFATPDENFLWDFFLFIGETEFDRAIGLRSWHGRRWERRGKCSIPWNFCNGNQNW